MFENVGYKKSKQLQKSYFTMQNDAPKQLRVTFRGSIYYNIHVRSALFVIPTPPHFISPDNGKDIPKWG